MRRRDLLITAAHGAAGLLTAARAGRAAPPAPGERSGHALAWHAAAAAVCLLGGSDAAMVDTFERPWLWNGRAWVQPRIVTGPLAASLVAAAADPDRRSVWMFGGFSVVAPRRHGPPVGDLWELDGSLAWRRAEPDGPRPGPRHHHALAFDTRRGRLVLYGGFDAADRWITDVWEWDRRRWHRLAPAVGPGERAHHAMAYDAARGRVVLRGGTRPDKSRPLDTWEWDGAAWHAVAGGGPGPGDGYRMAYDEARRVTLLFGGDTCVWDGRAWSAMPTTDAPPPRSLHALAYDPGRARVVLHGGLRAGEHLSDTWEWDGRAWHAATRP
jgi:hypothetical protein